MWFNWSDPIFTPYKTSVQILQTLRSLESYIIVNFRIHKINRGTRKLIRSSILI